MKDLLLPGFVLFATCVAVALGLGLTNEITKPIISQKNMEDAQVARKQVLSMADQFVPIYSGSKEEMAKDIDPSNAIRVPKEEVFQALKQGVPVGVVSTIYSKGYGGEITITVGIDNQGKVSGIKIGNHKETPGIGTKILNPSGHVMTQLLGLTPKGPLSVIKGRKPLNSEEIDAVSGSTITSRAVIQAVSSAWSITQSNLKGGTQ